MVSSLAKLCVHHMRLVRFPFLGLSVVTEAWQVKVGGVAFLVGEKGSHRQSWEEGAEITDTPGEEDRRAGRRHGHRREGHCQRAERQPRASLDMGREATRQMCGSPKNSSDLRGTEDLSQESDGRKAVSRRETLGGSLPPPLDLTWCVGITGAEGIRCRDSRFWRSLCSSCSFP